jgi:hypothetical protein
MLFQQARRLCCCSPTQTCGGSLISPLGWDVIVPSGFTCTDDSNPTTSTITMPPCFCSDMVGTHKLFKVQYVNQRKTADNCNWATTTESNTCSYHEVNPEATVDGIRKAGSVVPTTTECSETPSEKLYEKILSVYHRCRRFDGTNWLYPFEPHCEELEGSAAYDYNSISDARVSMTIGTTFQGPRIITVTLSVHAPAYSWNGTECVKGVVARANVAYTSSSFPEDTNLIDEGPITLTTTNLNAPPEITVQANSLDVPT